MTDSQFAEFDAIDMTAVAATVQTGTDTTFACNLGAGKTVLMLVRDRRTDITTEDGKTTPNMGCHGGFYADFTDHFFNAKKGEMEKSKKAIILAVVLDADNGKTTASNKYGYTKGWDGNMSEVKDAPDGATRSIVPLIVTAKVAAQLVDSMTTTGMKWAAVDADGNISVHPDARPFIVEKLSAAPWYTVSVDPFMKRWEKTVNGLSKVALPKGTIQDIAAARAEYRAQYAAENQAKETGVAPAPKGVDLSNDFAGSL